MAQMCGYQDMQQALTVIFEKLITNLTSLGNSKKEDDLRLVKASIETMHAFLLNAQSCKHCAKVPIVR